MICAFQKRDVRHAASPHVGRLYESYFTACEARRKQTPLYFILYLTLTYTHYLSLYYILYDRDISAILEKMPFVYNITFF